MNGNLIAKLSTTLLLLTLPMFLLAVPAAGEEAKSSSGQQSASLSLAAAKSAATPDPKPAAKPSSPAPVKPVKAKEGKLTRWFEVQTANLGFRYRNIVNYKYVTSTNQAQYKDEFKARFKFDKKGNYSINAGVITGSAFTSSWDTTGAGTGSPVTNLYLKQLYFAAKPVKGLELQYGGLYFNRGESTEITSYDNDGYLVGERLSVKRPRELFFDEVSVTYGYVGDTSKPNLNKRFNRLQKSNYHQFLVSKSITKRVAVSADYSFASGIETMREAVKVGTKELRVIDLFRVENYQRVDYKADGGVAFYGEKALHKRLSVGGGFATIDPLYGTLNADRFGIGKRLFIETKLALCPELSVATFYQHAISDYTSLKIPNKSRLDLIVTYNFLKTLQRTGLF